MVIYQDIATALELAKENRKIQIAGLGTGSRENPIYTMHTAISCFSCLGWLVQ